MTMTDWAENEVKIACKRENPDRKEGEWDYGCSCYESALKAYKSLMADGHSGASFGFTKNILIRLLNEKPLTPIADTEDVWSKVTDRQDGYSDYQCNRLGSLFKRVYENGKITYRDNNRAVGIDIENNTGYTSGLVSDIIDEMFPIEMPYNPPTNAYKVYTREYLIPDCEGDDGDYNTVEVLYCVKPDGEKVGINRYFAEKGGIMEEITKVEFTERMKKK